MNAHSLNKLEFNRIRELLAGHCRCALGRQLAGDVGPARKPTMIRRWLQQTAEMIGVIDAVGVPPLAGVHDIRDLIAQAVPPTRLSPKDFATIGETLAATHEIRMWVDAFPPSTPTLTSVTERLVDFKFISDQIGRAVDSDGHVRDGASDKLSRIRRAIEQAGDQIGVVMRRLLRSSSVTKMLQFPNATFHNDRIVLPLKSEHRGRLEGIIHRSSDTGATLFVEPAEVVELNNTIAKLRRDEHEEIGRILFTLTQAVHANAKAILKTVDAIGVIDVITAKVLMARDHEMIVPDISEDGLLRLRSARHPILQALSKADAEQGLEPRAVVPIDVRLGDDFDLLIVTGPNTGGKTVALKTVGLLTIMVHAGLPVPVSPGSCVPILDDVLIDIGDEQSLQQSLSTFSAHMSRILDILKRACKGTLVLLDELGAGTDPDEGAAIGRAIVDKLLGVGCPTMVTTHLGSLKAIGFTHERADNAAVEFDTNTLRPTFRMLIGEPGQSNALAVAAYLGMPEDLISAAQSHLPEQHKALSSAIAGTIESRRRAEEAREKAEEAKVAASDAEASARAMAKELGKKKLDFEDWAQRVTHLRAGDPVKVLSFDRTGRVVRIYLSRQRAEVDMGSTVVEVPLSDLHPVDSPAPPPKPVAQPTAVQTAKGKKNRSEKSERAAVKKGRNNRPEPGLPKVDTPPPMPVEQVLALEPGHRVFVRRLQKEGEVLRLEADKQKVVVDLGMMDAEIAFDDICQHCDKAGKERKSASGKRRKAESPSGKRRKAESVSGKRRKSEPGNGKKKSSEAGERCDEPRAAAKPQAKPSI